MSVSYKKLWKLLIDKDMKKKTLKKRQGSVTMMLLSLWGCLPFCF